MDEEEQALIDKYHIVKERRKRYYRISCTERRFDLECTNPHTLTIGDKVFKEHVWTELLENLTLYLFDQYPNKVSEAESYHTDWSKADIFSLKAKSNYRKLPCGLWLNCNHTALHSCWLVQDLLAWFQVDLNQVVFVIRRPSGAEEPEVQAFYRKKAIVLLTAYLESLGKNQKTIESIIQNIDDVLNPMLRKISKSYTDFLLFDSQTVYLSYSQKVIIYIRSHPKMAEKTKEVLIRYFDYLNAYYKAWAFLNSPKSLFVGPKRA
ncbi:MAG: hypothetical protein SOV58_00365 [Candidatus Enteromonas sp.]|nr:hypothetical protein [Candidatus Enteromonas sp.]